MEFVRTITGDEAPGKLGHCQCHEHLFIAKGRSYEINPALWMDDIPTSLAETQLYKSAGGGALVDAQPTGAGSMPEALLEVSKASGVKIIASTGFHKLGFYPEGHWIRTANEDTLKVLFAKDIVTGIAVDGDDRIPKKRIMAKAGIIKCALDVQGLDEAYQRLFRAAAGAALQTGAPMLIHTEDGTHTLALIEFLLSLGIAPERVIVCHIERSVERIEEKLEIAQTGVYIECDTIARFKYHSDEAEAMFIKRLADEGYGGRILLGLDTTRERLKSYGGITGLDYILKVFLPLLREKGITEQQINLFCIENPAAALRLR